MINTPHINCLCEIGETVLLPGDPLRAKMIGEKYLENCKCFNKIRGALGFTGEYKGKTISVMGTGMGIPSMGIYSYELINIFGVKNLIRIGTTGGMQDKTKVRDVIVAMAASTNSRFCHQYGLSGTFSAAADYELLEKAVSVCREKGIRFHVGNVLTSDWFYSDDEKALDAWRKMGILGTEMETAGLYMTAARYGAKALSILTVSDHMYTKEETTAEEREKTLTDMIETALETAVRL